MQKRKINFSIVLAHCASFMKIWSILRGRECLDILTWNRVRNLTLRSRSNLSESTLFQYINIIFFYKNPILCEKNVLFRMLLQFFFFKLHPKNIDFVNSDDCIGNVSSISEICPQIRIFEICLQHHQLNTFWYMMEK